MKWWRHIVEDWRSFCRNAVLHNTLLLFKCFLVSNVAQNYWRWCNFFLLYENVYVKRKIEKSGVYKRKQPRISFFFLSILHEMDGLYVYFSFVFILAMYGIINFFCYLILVWKLDKITASLGNDIPCHDEELRILLFLKRYNWNRKRLFGFFYRVY